MSITVQVGREVTVAEDDGGGELSNEPFQKGTHTLSLRLGARVIRVAHRIEATLVADADAVFVVALAVSPDLPQRPALMHQAVARDIEVVSDILPPPLEVVVLALLEAVSLCRLRAAAVQHYQCYRSHLEN